MNDMELINYIKSKVPLDISDYSINIPNEEVSFMILKTKVSLHLLDAFIHNGNIPWLFWNQSIRFIVNREHFIIDAVNRSIHYEERSREGIVLPLGQAIDILVGACAWSERLTPDQFIFKRGNTFQIEANSDIAFHHIRQSQLLPDTKLPKGSIVFSTSRLPKSGYATIERKNNVPFILPYVEFHASGFAPDRLPYSIEQLFNAQSMDEDNFTKSIENAYSLRFSGREASLPPVIITDSLELAAANANDQEGLWVSWHTLNHSLPGWEFFKQRDMIYLAFPRKNVSTWKNLNAVCAFCNDLDQKVSFRSMRVLSFFQDPMESNSNRQSNFSNLPSSSSPASSICCPSSLAWGHETTPFNGQGRLPDPKLLSLPKFFKHYSSILDREYAMTPLITDTFASPLPGDAKLLSPVARDSSFMLIHGAPGLEASMFVFSMALAVSQGGTLVGNWAAGRKAKVIYIFAEEGYFTSQWMLTLKYPSFDLSSFQCIPFRLDPSPVNLKLHVSQLMQYPCFSSMDFSLVVFDRSLLVRSISGDGKEAERIEFLDFIQYLKRQRISTWLLPPPLAEDELKSLKESFPLDSVIRLDKMASDVAMEMRLLVDVEKLSWKVRPNECLRFRVSLDMMETTPEWRLRSSAQHRGKSRLDLYRMIALADKHELTGPQIAMKLGISLSMVKDIKRNPPHGMPPLSTPCKEKGNWARKHGNPPFFTFPNGSRQT